MPYLIDGNNLAFALGAAGHDSARSGLCRLLGNLASERDWVLVVFDGPAPQGPLARQVGDPRVRAVYAAPRKADAVILDEIAACTAPRRLVVVSSDREIRQAARRRRCRDITSQQFVPVLLDAATPRPPAPPNEPDEKRHGLASGQVEEWMRLLGLTPPDEPPR